MIRLDDLDPAQREAVESEGLHILTLRAPEDPGYSSATFSPKGSYRYTLWRVWDPAKPIYQVIGLNPSTADHLKNDPTVARCVKRAMASDCGSFVMTNLFAYRATDPKVMKARRNPVGNLNDDFLRAVAEQAKVVVAAWGHHGTFMNRADEVAEMIPNLQCLGTTKDGHPRHPLYLRDDAELRPWSPPG